MTWQESLFIGLAVLVAVNAFVGLAVLTTKAVRAFENWALRRLEKNER